MQPPSQRRAVGCPASVHECTPATHAGDTHPAATGAAHQAAHARLQRLRIALRRERARARAAHWTYDLARHLALARELRRATAALAAPVPPQQPPT